MPNRVIKFMTTFLFTFIDVIWKKVWDDDRERARDQKSSKQKSSMDLPLQRFSLLALFRAIGSRGRSGQWERKNGEMWSKSKKTQRSGRAKPERW